jgi:hypothetical protein
MHENAVKASAHSLVMLGCDQPMTAQVGLGKVYRRELVL